MARRIVTGEIPVPKAEALPVVRCSACGAEQAALVDGVCEACQERRRMLDPKRTMELRTVWY